MKGYLRAFTLFVALAWLGPHAMVSAAAAQAFGGTYTFDVLRNGEPVGLHTFSFRHDGRRMEIDAQSDFQIKLAFIPVYTFSHHQQQIWEDGEFVEAEAVTDKNGEKMEVTLEAEPGGLKRTVNGRSDHLAAGTTPLTLWNPEILKERKFVSLAEDKVIEAPFEYLGTEMLEVAGQPIKTEHFKLGANEQREVWYDPAGHVARVRLKRGDSVIEYVRNEPTLDLPQQLACSSVAELSC